MAILHTRRAFPISIIRLASLLAASLLSSTLLGYGNKWDTETLPFVYEGEYLNIRLHATDNVVYKLLDGPAGLTLTREGNMRYKPDFNAAGEYTLKVLVTSRTDKIEKQWILNVKDVNRQPEFLTPTPSASLNEGETFSYTPKVTDADNDKIRLGLKNAPKGLSINNNQLHWQTTYEQAGTYTFAVIASDGTSQTEQAITLNVADKNRPPQWVTQHLPAATETQPYQAQIIADDSDDGALTYALISAPDGVSLEGNHLRWLPGYTAAGKRNIVVAVSDHTSTVDKTFQLVVNNTNRIPEFVAQKMPDAQEDTVYAFTIKASDADNEPLSFALTSAPQGMHISDNGRIEWQPDFSQAGQHTLNIQVTDGESTINKTAQLTVNNTNRPPQFNSLTLDNAIENTPYQMPIAASDPDAEPLQVTLIKGPKGMQINAQGDLQWQPDFESAGQHPITLQLSDGSLTVKKTFSLQVDNTNRLPVITSTPLIDAAEAAAYQYMIQFSDDDNDALQLELVQAPAAMQLKNQQLLWTPGYQDVGTTDIELRVYEKNNPQAEHRQRFVLNIENTNREPVWQTSKLAPAKEGVAYTAQLRATDVDGQWIRYRVANAPEGLTLSDAGDLTWQPTYFQSGSYPLTFIADDSESTVPLKLQLDVINQNRAPEITSQAPVTAEENAPYTYVITAQDIDEEPITLTLAKAPKGMQLEDGVISWLPTFKQAGRHAFILQASDGTQSVTQPVTVQVANTNQRPVWQIPADNRLMLKENAGWKLPVLAKDADGQKLSYRLLTAIEGLTLTNQQLRWTPSFVQAGDYSLILQASDGESSEELIVNVQVTDNNRPPRIISKPIVAATENERYQYALSVLDADPEDNDNLVYSLTEAPEGMDILDGILSWHPDFDAAGTHTVALTVSDGKDTVQQSFSLNVNNTNRAPEFITAPVTDVTEMTDYQYSIDITDADGQPVQLQLLEAPHGMILKDHQLSWSPSYDDAGTYPVKLAISDGQLTRTQAFELIVNNLNRLPVVSSQASSVSYESIDYRYQLAATDADADPITYRLINPPAGMQLVGDQVQWQPSFEQSGDYTIKVAVADGIDSFTHTFQMHVQNTNREPAFTAIADQHIRPKKTFRQPLEAMDVDGSPVTFRLIHGPKAMTISGDNALLWKPTQKDKGKHTIIVSVTDGDLKVRRHFDISVR